MTRRCMSTEPVSRRLSAGSFFKSNTGLHIRFSPVCRAASGKDRDAASGRGGVGSIGREGGETAELLLYLQQRFGSVSSFSGSYRADRWEFTGHQVCINIQTTSALSL